MKNLKASSYSKKLDRLDKCAALQKTDRVPIGAATLYFPAKYSCISYEDMLYDQEKYRKGSVKFAQDFNWDAACMLRTFETVTLGLALAGTDPPSAVNAAAASVLGGGFAHDLLKDNYSSHPGRELPPDVESQFKIKQPPSYMALCPNPLDVPGAFLRDFDKAILDIHRIPDKVHKACEALLPVLLAVGKATGEISFQLTGSRRVFLPVWYNSFLSVKQFKEFHWPYLKYLCEELIKDGFTPLLSLQGTYDHLLDTLLELPAGKAIAWFDRTDPI